jgi:retinol dehydrogenase-12
VGWSDQLSELPRILGRRERGVARGLCAEELCLLLEEAMSNFFGKRPDEEDPQESLAPFLMTTGLLDLMPKGARIVNINSAGHFAPIVGTGTVEIDFEDLQFTCDFNPYMAYSRSKLANLLFSYELDRRHGEDLYVNAVHPGMVRSRMARDFPRWQAALVAAMAISPKAGSEPVLAMIAAPSPTRGMYYDRFTPTTSSPQSRNTVTAAMLWAISESFVRN